MYVPVADVAVVVMASCHRYCHLLHCRGRGSQIIARRGAAIQVPIRIRRVITVRHDGLRAVRAAGIALPFRLIRRAARRLDIAQHPWIILIRLAHQVTVPRVSGVRSAGGRRRRRDRGCRAHGGVRRLRFFEQRIHAALRDAVPHLLIRVAARRVDDIPSCRLRAGRLPIMTTYQSGIPHAPSFGRIRIRLIQRGIGIERLGEIEAREGPIVEILIIPVVGIAPIHPILAIAALLRREVLQIVVVCPTRRDRIGQLVRERILHHGGAPDQRHVAPAIVIRHVARIRVPSRTLGRLHIGAGKGIAGIVVGRGGAGIDAMLIGPGAGPGEGLVRSLPVVRACHVRAVVRLEPQQAGPARALVSRVPRRSAVGRGIAGVLAVFVIFRVSAIPRHTVAIRERLGRIPGAAGSSRAIFLHLAQQQHPRLALTGPIAGIDPVGVGRRLVIAELILVEHIPTAASGRTHLDIEIVERRDRRDQWRPLGRSRLRIVTAQRARLRAHGGIDMSDGVIGAGDDAHQRRPCRARAARLGIVAGR